MDVTIKLPHSSVVLPLTYDLKIALLEVNEQAGEQATQEGKREEAVQAFAQNLQLFRRGEPLFGEGLQYLATLGRLRELNAQAPEHPRTRWWHKLANKMRRTAGSSGPLVELDDKRWETMFKKLLSLQERAHAQGDAVRAEEIASIFRLLENAGLWQRCGA